MKIFAPINFNIKGRTQESQQKPATFYSNINDSFSCEKKANYKQINNYNVSFGASREDYLKQRIKAIYSTISNQMTVYAKDKYNLDFIKPDLKFINTEDDGDYCIYNNTISISTRYLNKKRQFIVPSKPTSIIRLEDETYEAIEVSKPFPNSRYAKKEEVECSIGETISHELSHAVAAQLGLSAPNAKEAIISQLKEFQEDNFKNMSDDEIFEQFIQKKPFIKSFIPQNVTNTQFEVISSEDHLLEYDSTDLLLNILFQYEDDWATRLEEIDANKREADFNSLYMADFFPKVQKSKIKSFVDASTLTYQEGAERLYQTLPGEDCD